MLLIADRSQKDSTSCLFSVYKTYRLYKIRLGELLVLPHFRAVGRPWRPRMPPGRPTRDEPTCVLAVRVPVALRDALDRYLDALETRVGLKASRNAIIRHALRLFLETQQPAGRLTPPQRLDEP